jgi:hypothetical protein
LNPRTLGPVAFKITTRPPRRTYLAVTFNTAVSVHSLLLPFTCSFLFQETFLCLVTYNYNCCKIIVVSLNFWEMAGDVSLIDIDTKQMFTIWPSAPKRETSLA